MLSFIALLAFQQAGPVMPVGVAPHLSRLSLEIQQALSTGEFDVATSAFSRWPAGSLSYSLEGMHETYKQADIAAASLVKDASGGSVLFSLGSSPAVTFRFLPMTAEGPNDPIWKDGRVLMTIHTTDRGGAPANARSIVWGLAKGMAYAAGLDVNTKRRSMMGPVSYTRSLSDPIFSLREQSLFTQLAKVRTSLKAAIDGKVRLVPAVPKIEVTPAVVNMGAVTQGDLKEFALTIKNTGNAPASLEIETTCSCLIATPTLTIPAGGLVEMKPKFDSADYQGSLEKHLYVLSNSLESPRETVVLKAVIVPEIRFFAPKGSAVHGSAGEADLIEIEAPDAGASTAELIFFGTQTPIELLDVQLGNRSAKANIVPFEGRIEDPITGSAIRNGAKVLIDLPEDWPFGVNWLRVVGVTNSKRKPSVEMTLQIRRGISVSPQTAYFGDAKVGTQSERIVMIEHTTKPFKVIKVETDPGIVAAVEKADEFGRRYRIVIRVTPAVVGPISGSVRISTDSPAQPVITIPVGGQAG
ncbi:MAG: DUF1573 domain-containing protein [Armatimonadota bacterium]|nr:DUF1573 domain-containing protein [Armatimonadota bacterium]